jgi:hypothetical protein
MVKKRSKQQRESKISEAKLELALNEWVLNKQTDDFGIDYEVRICDKFDTENQIVTESSFYIQLKETSENRKPFESFSTDDLRLFLGQSIPVILFLYITPKDRFYWVIVQDYVWDILSGSDSEWRKKKKIRIHFQNELRSISELKAVIEKAQRKIIRMKTLSLDIGEGISPGYDLEFRDRALKEYKHISMQKAFKDIFSGNVDVAQAEFEQIIQLPQDDEYKLNAILNAVFQKGSWDPDCFEGIIKLSELGIAIAARIKAFSFQCLFNILRDQVLMNELYISMSQPLISKTIITQQKNPHDIAFFSIFYDQRIKELLPIRQLISDDINKNIYNLLKGGFKTEFEMALVILLDIVIFSVQRLAPLIPELLDNEEYRKPLISFCEKTAAFSEQLEIKQAMYQKLSMYYYLTKNPKFALVNLRQSMKYAEEVGHTAAIEGLQILKKEIEDKPDPYKIFKEELLDPESLTTLEAKECATRMVELQGFDLSKDDKETAYIKIALNDLDPSAILKNCENLRTVYYNTSMMGRSIGLPSLGMKLIWCCEIKRSAMHFYLDECYALFNHLFCQNCEKCRPRDTNWICTQNWIDEESKNPEILLEIEKYRKKGF